MVVSGDEVSGFTGPKFPNPPVHFSLRRSEPFFGDLGYSLELPWPAPTTAGWWFEGGLPEEKVLITRPDPEWFAPNDLIRTNGGLPIIDTKDPIYSFDRRDYTIPVTSSNYKNVNWSDYVAKDRQKREQEFRGIARI